MGFTITYFYTSNGQSVNNVRYDIPAIVNSGIFLDNAGQGYAPCKEMREPNLHQTIWSSEPSVTNTVEKAVCMIVNGSARMSCHSCNVRSNDRVQDQSSVSAWFLRFFKESKSSRWRNSFRFWISEYSPTEVCQGRRIWVPCVLEDLSRRQGPIMDFR